MANPLAVFLGFALVGTAIGVALSDNDTPAPAPARKRRRARAVSWQEFETETCATFNADHVGGPGREDCAGDGFLTEAKHHARPVGPRHVERIYERSVAVGQNARLVSSSGFTASARAVAAELGVELHHHPARRKVA